VTDEPIDPELDRLFDLLAEEERGEPDPVEHPGAATLSAYYAHTLPADQVPRVQEHLVACGQCRAQLLEHSQFMGSPTEEPEDNVSSFEGVAEWRRLKERMDREPRELYQGRNTHKDRPLRSWGTGNSVAAVLAVAFVGVSLYAGSLLRELKQPVTNMGSETLLASQRSLSTGSKVVRLPNFLVIEVQATRPFPKYQIDFEDSRGTLVETFNDNIEEDGTIKTFLPRRFLKPGNYRVIVSGVKGDSREQLGTYNVHIVP
jgi:hypothetical protein